MNENDPGKKAGRYFEKTRDGKQILRDVMGCYIPQDISRAEKQGFSAPDASWFKGESLNYVKHTLLSADAPIYQYLDRESVQALINDHLSGRTNRRLLIWSLLNFKEWLDRFL